jgi:hypothetical protein
MLMGKEVIRMRPDSLTLFSRVVLLVSHTIEVILHLQ